MGLERSLWLPWANRPQRAREWKQETPGEAGRATQVGDHRDVMRRAMCSLQASAERGQETPQREFQGEVLNSGYHLGLDILNTEDRPYLG